MSAERQKKGVESEEVHIARPSTSTHALVTFAVGILGTIVFSIGVFPLKGTRLDYFYAVINERHFVQYLELIMAWMVIATVIQKVRILRRQRRILLSNPVPLSVDLNDDAQVYDLRHAVTTSPGAGGAFYRVGSIVC